MCLDTVTSITRDRKREGIGWKAFRLRGGELHSEFNGGVRKKGVWLESVDNGTQNYPLGFHRNMSAIVAKEMMIL